MPKIIEDNESIYDSDREDWNKLPTKTKSKLKGKWNKQKKPPRAPKNKKIKK